MTRPELTPAHARAVAFLMGLDVTDDTPVTVVAAPTRAPDREAAWRAAAEGGPEGGLVLAPLDVLPGDHMLRAVREQAALHVARHGGSPEQAARQIVDLGLGYSGPGKPAWQAWLEIVRRGLDSGAPWVDRLTDPSLRPGTLTELTAGAASHGLAWLCDARLANTSLALLPRVARAYADDDAERTGVALRAEQLADIVRNQYARVGLFRRGGGTRRAAVELDRVPALSWIGTSAGWDAWALEPLDARAAAELDASDAPAALRAVVSALPDSGPALDWAALRRVTGAGDQALSEGVVAAWALGFTRPMGALP